MSYGFQNEAYGLEVNVSVLGRNEDFGQAPENKTKNQSATYQESSKLLRQCELRLRHVWYSFIYLVQRLIFAEIRDGESKRINLNEVIAHLVSKGKDEVSCVLRAFDLAAVERRSINQRKFNGCFVG